MELALFFRPRLESLWLQMVFDWVIKRVRDEYIDIKIEKYRSDNDKLKLLLERERERRARARPTNIS